MGLERLQVVWSIGAEIWRDVLARAAQVCHTFDHASDLTSLSRRNPLWVKRAPYEKNKRKKVGGSSEARRKEKTLLAFLSTS